MNNDAPLLPGTLLDQKNKGRARVKIAVFAVLAVHGIGLLALLMQGCNKPEAPTTTDQTAATNQPVVEPATNTMPAAAPAPTNTTTAVTPTPAPALATEPIPPAVTPTATDYKIAAGDNFSSLAKKFHVTVKAIAEANPGVEPTKLQIGQTIHIPAAPAAAPAPTPGTTSADAAGEQIHVVKSGDTLTKIAHDAGVTVKALRAANNLKTDSIKVGDKLKIPARTAPAPGAGTEAPAASTTAPAR